MQFARYFDQNFLEPEKEISAVGIHALEVKQSIPSVLTLEELRKNMRNLHRQIVTRSVNLLHDNVTELTPCTFPRKSSCPLEVISSPEILYIPNLFPSDHLLFPNLFLGRKHFYGDKASKETVGNTVVQEAGE